MLLCLAGNNFCKNKGIGSLRGLKFKVFEIVWAVTLSDNETITDAFNGNDFERGILFQITAQLGNIYIQIA
jgi:hypothetical protein